MITGLLDAETINKSCVTYSIVSRSPEVSLENFDLKHPQFTMSVLPLLSLCRIRLLVVVEPCQQPQPLKTLSRQPIGLEVPVATAHLW